MQQGRQWPPLDKDKEHSDGQTAPEVSAKPTTGETERVGDQPVVKVKRTIQIAKDEAMDTSTVTTKTKEHCTTTGSDEVTPIGEDIIEQGMENEDKSREDATQSPQRIKKNRMDKPNEQLNERPRITRRMANKTRQPKLVDIQSKTM
jgi:hypothetical protein